MNKKELNKFLEWYKKTKEFKDVPDKDKPIHLAQVIKEATNTQIISNTNL